MKIQGIEQESGSKMNPFEAVIGLEVHVQLATVTKLFCSCSNKFGQSPNTNVCEICSGMPGSLPVPNRQAIHYAVLAGLATNCKINQVSVFARKNYFYPDLPHGYQISQFELPICEHGYIDISTEKNGMKRVGITRIHMENDAGKNIHDPQENKSFVDLNRAGTPLVEIVSEPDMCSGAEAVSYLKTLYNMVKYLGICDGNMEEGSFRCDANVSIRQTGSKNLGTRTELKNLNSFRNVQKAIEYEIERQTDEMLDGHGIVQETRLFDPVRNITKTMRSKEQAEDYRYFPDPDILPIIISDEQLCKWKDELPELPQQRAMRFASMTGLPDAEIEVLVQSKGIADFFEEAAKNGHAKKIASYILGPLMRECNAHGIDISSPHQWHMSPQNMAELAVMEEEGKISSKIANDIFGDLFRSGNSPEEYIKAKGLLQISDSKKLEVIIDEIIDKNPDEVVSYKSGKKKLISFFVGQVMRHTKGKANPAMVNEIILRKLG